MTRERVDVEDISPVAQDYLKAIWSATEWGGPPVSTSALAARFGTSPANVSETMRRLDAQGLVRHVPYRPVELTPRGTAYAVAMVRRHRLVETFLVGMLGYGWDEVHEEAERLEHALSDLLVERIDAALGHPEADPHGDPIPDPGGSVRTPRDAVPLSDPDLGTGVVTVTRISDADPAVLDAAGSLGLGPGATIRLGADGPSVGDRSIPSGIADALWVVPVRTGGDRTDP